MLTATRTLRTLAPGLAVQKTKPAARNPPNRQRRARAEDSGLTLILQIILIRN